MAKYKFEIINSDDKIMFTVDKVTNVITMSQGNIIDIFRTSAEMVTFTNTLPQILNLLKICEVHTIEIKEE